MGYRVPCLLLLAVALAAPAEAGIVRGTVRINSVAPASGPAGNPYPGRAGSMSRADGFTRGSIADAVVFIEQIPPAVDSALATTPERPRLAQKNQTFTPRVIAIAAGETVDFPNFDPIYHNVFSPSPVRRFDLGKYSRGQSRSVTFPRPGLVNVFCDIHSNMEAYVLVLANRAFARPDAEGRYKLPDLPPGTYVVRAWHPDFPERKREVLVPAEGEALLDLSF
jgi:plastocyanin